MESSYRVHQICDKDTPTSTLCVSWGTAFNYKDELLVTALVHNFSHHRATFPHRTVTLQCGEFFEEHVCTIPELVIAPFTSMPWTFIFAPNAAYKKLDLQQLVLEIYE